MNIELFYTGCTIMVIGMAVVFFFLVLMIGVMNVCTKIIEKLNEIFPEVVEQKAQKKNKKTDDDTQIAIAIAIAIAAQRSGL